MIKINLVLTLGTLYWGFSEQYIHGGDFYYGCLKGFLVLSVCGFVGYILGKVITS